MQLNYSFSLISEKRGISNTIRWLFDGCTGGCHDDSRENYASAGEEEEGRRF